MFGDNRDLTVKVVEKTKYHPHIQSMVLAFMKRFPIRHEKHVLDVGTRDGYAVELLSENGYNSVGVELIQEYVDHAVARGRKVLFDDFMNTQVDHGAFTHIISRHCIEHCRDTDLFFRNCSKVLVPFGWLFLTVPLETKDEFMAREHPGKNHMVYFPDKDSLRSVAEKYFITEYCGKSKHVGIDPVGREVLYIGHTKGTYDNPRLPGHMLEEELEYLHGLAGLIECKEKPIVVEIGPFLGKSSHAIGSGLQKKFKEFEFTCVDLFDDSKCDKTYKGFEKYSPFETFQKNMADTIHGAKVGDSVEASEDYYSNSVDAMFIDGNHTYDGVMADLKAWWPKIKNGGYMLGHDYKLNQFGVKRAVDEFFGNKAQLVCGSIWKVQKC